MLSYFEGKQQLLDAVECSGHSVRVPVTDALHLVCATDLKAPMSVAPFDNSAMDGYAVRAADLANGPGELRVIDVAYAGKPAKEPVSSGTAIRIFTGAVIPHGADAVVIQENVTTVSNNVINTAHVPSPGEWIRPAGNDVKHNDLLITRGQTVGPYHLALLLSCGIAQLDVFKPLSVAVFSNGDELVPPGSNLLPGQIFDSNRHMLGALLAQPWCTVKTSTCLADDFEHIISELQDAAENNDVVITCGGASVGDADHMGDALRRLGDINFWKLAIKPGKPLLVGTLNRRNGSKQQGDNSRAQYFGLPGNPVSAAITFNQLVKPALRKMAGVIEAEAHYSPLAVLAEDIERDTERTEFMRVNLRTGQDGQQLATPCGAQGSDRISSLVQAHALMRIDGPARTLNKGESFPIEYL